MTAEEAKKRALEVMEAKSKEDPKPNFISLEEILKLIEVAANEGQESVKFHQEMSEETILELTNMGYWVLPHEVVIVE